MTIGILRIECNAIAAVPTTCFSIIFVIVIAFAIAQKQGFLHLAARKAVVEVAVPAIPAALGNVVFIIRSAVRVVVTMPIAHGRRTPHVTTGIPSVELEAVATVPPALGCVVALPVELIILPVAHAIANFFGFVDMAIGMAVHEAVATVPAAPGSVVVTVRSIAVPIANIRWIINMTIWISLHEAVATVPPAPGSVVLPPHAIALAVANQAWIFHVTIGISLHEAVATVPPALLGVVGLPGNALLGEPTIVPVAYAIGNVLGFVDMTSGISLHEAVATVPPARGGVVPASVAGAVADAVAVADTAIPVPVRGRRGSLDHHCASSCRRRGVVVIVMAEGPVQKQDRHPEHG